MLLDMHLFLCLLFGVSLIRLNSAFVSPGVSHDNCGMDDILHMEIVRVVHIVPQNGVGGVEIAACSMLDRSDLEIEFKLLFLSNKCSGTTARGALSSPGIRPWNFSSLKWSVETVSRISPDVLICSLWRSVPIALIAKLLRPKIRLVLFLHADRSTHWVDAVLTSAAAIAADEIWCDCDSTKQRRIPSIARSTRRRIISFVIKHRDQISLPSLPKPRFVTWCRLTHQKAVDRSIDLIRLMRARGIEANFEIWGPDGGTLVTLRQQVIDLSLGEHIHFKGVASPDLLADIAMRNCFFLHPSRFEGMAIAVVEAMQMGLVPVVTPTGQMADYVRSGENGVIFDPDRPDETVTEIARLIEDPGAYDRLRDGALAHWRTAPLYADDVCAAARTLATT